MLSLVCMATSECEGVVLGLKKLQHWEDPATVSNYFIASPTN